MTVIDTVLALVPLVPTLILMAHIVQDPMHLLGSYLGGSPSDVISPSVESHLIAYVLLAMFGFLLTNQLIPNIKKYTLRRGISGKDLGKKGTATADNDIPEALGMVSGTVFLVCLIFALVGYATTHPAKLLDCNSALLSICFMLFLGFTDDVLDWPWRYKLVLPSIASLPLLCCYNGSTSIVVPIQLRGLLMQNHQITWFGHILGFLITIDDQANGKVVNLGMWYLIYMGLLAVFCTNAINIYAGINGLEAGQAYVVASAVLVHNLIEIYNGTESVENHLFSVMLMLPFCGVTLGLLRYNWCPAQVFVGDTFCYFSGMTFAVVGILGHFSKTLLLFFIPQVINFLWSVPQLFKLVPCPRHRLPKYNPTLKKMVPSTFPCKPHQFKLFKRTPDATECPNMTVINLMLLLMGPMTERNLCLALLTFQTMSCAFGLLVRYYIAQFFFDE